VTVAFAGVTVIVTYASRSRISVIASSAAFLSPGSIVSLCFASASSRAAMAFG
jgi:hypothetical protein